jgi:ABC-2 type transport system permease protein
MRYLRLTALQLRASFLLAVQYRFDFVAEGVVGVFWLSTALVPLFAVFQARDKIAGWTFGEALMVVGWFTLLDGVLEGVITPSLVAVVDHIRKGTLDLVLLKPADAQFLVSTARLQPWRVVHGVAASLIFGWGFHLLGRRPSPGALVSAAIMLVAAVAVLYSFAVLTVSAAFYAVRLDNLTHLFSAVFDAARWPIGVFRGAVRTFFTFVVPLAVMTTYPALALLGALPATTLLAAVAGAAIALALSRAVWTASLAKYTSAGG